MMRRVWRVARVSLVVGLVAFTAYGGIGDGLSTIREAASAFQSVAAAMQLVYGGLAVAILLAMAFRPRRVAVLLFAWGVALTFVATVASVVWGEQGWAVAAAGGAATAVIVVLVIAGWRAHARSAGAAGRG